MERKIYIQRKRSSKDAWIHPAPKTGNTEQQYNVFYEDQLIGSWAVPECDAARWLIAQGKAERNDRLMTYRRYPDKPDQASLYGSVGWFADRTVKEDGPGGTRFVKYVPFPVDRLRTGSTKLDEAG